MADESNPWIGTVSTPEVKRTPAPMVQRKDPVSERTINNAEVLAGTRGPKMDHAVRFRDLENIKIAFAEAYERQMAQSFLDGELSKVISGQFAAIDAESKAIQAAFDQAFIDVAGSIGVVDATLETFSTTLDGNTASISSLTGSLNGVTAVHGIKINNNGHISGFGLISQLVAGVPVSDFIISDASFRIVNNSGVGNYTPFAVYPTGRIVDGKFVPAGVHAQDLFVTRANIAEAAVDTLTIAGNAVTVPATGSGTMKTGDGTAQVLCSATISFFGQAPVLIIWTIEQGYIMDGPTWGYRVKRGSTVVDERLGMTATNDFPTGQLFLAAQGTAGATSTLTYSLEWIGSDANITGMGTMTVLAVRR